MRLDYDVWNDEIAARAEGRRPPFPWSRFLITGVVVLGMTAFLLLKVRA